MSVTWVKLSDEAIADTIDRSIGTIAEPMRTSLRTAFIALAKAVEDGWNQAMKEVQKDGIAYARKRNPKLYLGRKPSFTREQFGLVQDMLGAERGIASIAKETGLTRQTVYRIKGDPSGAEAMLILWGL